MYFNSNKSSTHEEARSKQLKYCLVGPQTIYTNKTKAKGIKINIRIMSLTILSKSSPKGNDRSPESQQV